MRSILLLISFVLLLIGMIGKRCAFVRGEAVGQVEPFVSRHLVSRQVADPLSRIAVWKYMNRIGLKFPAIVFKQAIMESGLVSDIAIHNNNILGLRKPVVRLSTAIGERYGYAVYSSWESCVDDYAIFQKGFSGTTENDYYCFLKSYGDSAYVENLKNAYVTIPKNE